MSQIVFDIETGPIPDAELSELFTFDESSIKGFDLLSKEFNPADVKVGNMKDEEKIAAKIKEAQQKFEMEKSGAKAAMETGRADAWEKFKHRAALSPLTGQVLAVGLWCPKWEEPRSVMFVSETADEKEVVSYVLGTLDAFLSSGHRLIGHNIIGFDLPFLLRRGLKYGIAPPTSIMSHLNQYRSTMIVDTIREWQFGNRSEGFAKLDDLSAFFGVTRKNGSGANFYKLFNGTPEERLSAIQYLENDITMTVEVAEKMGVIQ